MRIILTVRNFDFGGAENHVRELANSLASRGHRVWVAAPPGRQVELLHPTVRHIAIRYSDVLHPVQGLWLANFVRREGIDLIHAHQRLATLTSLIAGRIAACPVVVTLHGELQRDLTSRPGAAEMLTRLVVVSPFFEDLVSRHSAVLAPKTVCIPNGVRCVHTSAARDDGRLVVTFASRLSPGMTPFLASLVGAAGAVAREFPAFELHIFGDGRALPGLVSYADAVNRAAGRSVVRLEGYHADLPVVLATASLALGVGRVAIEALMQGVPVIPVNWRYLGEPVSPRSLSALAAMNFVPQHSPAPTRTSLSVALGNALSGLGHLAEEAREMQPLVAREYDIDVITDRHEDVYGDVALAPVPKRARAFATATASASTSLSSL
jgi:glycosyltransferase involved in cell wall biosynthesis